MLPRPLGNIDRNRLFLVGLNCKSAFPQSSAGYDGIGLVQLAVFLFE